MASGINVILGREGFDIIVEPSTTTYGGKVFIVTDEGFGHELLVIKTDETAADIIAAAIIGQSFNEDGYDIRVDTDIIPHGDTIEAEASLEPGHYVFVCNAPGHAHLGMAVDYTVTTRTAGDMIHMLGAGITSLGVILPIRVGSNGTIDGAGNPVSPPSRDAVEKILYGIDSLGAIIPFQVDLNGKLNITWS